MAGPESIFCVPHADPGERLIGRDAILEQLDATLSTTAGPTLLTALQGTGGIGKTQLAARYCWSRRRHHPGGIVWLNIADPTRAVSELVSWAEQLHLEITDPSDRAKANAVLGCVRGRSDALVILDNLGDPAFLDRDLRPDLVNSRPRGLGCKLLITSRQQVPNCQEIKLDFLPTPLDSKLLLREAGRGPLACEEAEALTDLLSLLGGLPLALVMIGRLLADRPHVTLAGLRNTLRNRGAVSILSEHVQIPPDYHQKIGSSFRAVLIEIWDILLDLHRRVLVALAMFGENAFVPEDVLPLMLKLPAPDPDGLDQPPLEQTLAPLESAQLVERNRVRGLLRLHPLVQNFAQQQEPGSTALLLDRVAHELESAKPILSLPNDRLSEIARALESLSKLNSGSGAAQEISDLCHMLRIEAHMMALTADPIVRSVDPAQLAYAAALHGRTGLKAAAEEVARAKGTPYMQVRWTTAEAERYLRHRMRGHERWISGCAVSANGQTGLSASDDQILIVWDLATGQQLRRLDGHADAVFSCGLSADGRIGLSASADKTLVVWDLQTGRQRHRLHGHNGGVWGCAVSADGRTGLSASSDHVLIVWDLGTGRERHRLRGHMAAVSDCAITVDGGTGISASHDETLILWDLATGQERYRLSGHEGWISGCAISADGSTGLSAGADQMVIVWDLLTGKERRRLRGHEGWASSCAVSVDGRIGLSASADETLIVWDIMPDEGRRRLRGHEGWVWDCAVSADGRIGLSASSDRTLTVWHLATGQECYRLRGHAGQVFGCAVSTDGRAGLSASQDRTLIAWDLAFGQERYRLSAHEGEVNSCAVSADGCTGLSASEDGTLIVWDLGTGKVRHRLRGHVGQVWGCAVSADGRIGLSAPQDQTPIVWDLATQRKRHSLAGHQLWVRHCAVSADGRIGVSASGDQTLIVWDLSTGRERHRLRLHNGDVNGCAISGDGRAALSTSVDRTLIVWDLTTGEAVSRLALDAIADSVALSQTRVILIGDRKGNVTCLEIVP